MIKHQGGAGSPRTWLFALALLLYAASSATAQVFTGRIDVTVQDATGAVLPGVTVEVLGPQNQNAATDAQGEAHLLNLPPGTYQVKATLAGFSYYVNRAVEVRAGASVPLRVSLSVGGVTEQVQVSIESPIVDPKREAVSTTISYAELQNIPSARDPWVVLQTVPGIVVDRVNVGGSESGQQSNYTAKGADVEDNTWNLDGIPITDMDALGSTPTYYDFDMFQEMNITTGGADVQASTPGVQLNFILKSGTNTVHGTSRVFYENKDLQGSNLPSELRETLGGVSGKGNRIDRYADYGGEIGGPILKNRWWGWGSLARTNVTILTLDGVPDKTTLTDASVKTNAQFTPKWRANFTFFSGNKQKDGRGAGPYNPPETTFIQDGPSKLYKGEVNYVASNSLYLTTRFARVNGPFTLDPKGGLDKQVFVDADGVYHNTNQFYVTDRPQKTVLVDGNWFQGRQELKFGGSFRGVNDHTELGFGNGWLNYEQDAETGLTLAVPFRTYIQNTSADYSALYLGDTISLSRLTANLAVRYDRTTDSVLASHVPAHPDLPQVLPGVDAPAVKNAIVMNSWTPRVGVTYAVDNDRKTQLRASYAAFASQLNITTANAVSAAGYAYAYFFAVDANHNRNIELNELGRSLGTVGVNPDNPLQVVNQIDPDLSAPRTHEIVAGIDRELMPNFGVSASYTWRRYNNLLWPLTQLPVVGVTSADYDVDGTIDATLPDGTPVSAPYYALREDRAPEGGGSITKNRDGYHRTFKGFEVAATKRLANRWMGRFGLSWNNEREYFDDPSTAIVDPTSTTGDPHINGGTVTRETGGSSKSQIYLTAPKYQFIANGYYQGPWGVNVGANFLLRQGFSQVYFANDVATNDAVHSKKDVLLVGDPGKYRLPTLKQLDFRVEKDVRFGGRRIALDFDVFNLLNSGTVLGRQYDVQASNFNAILEIMNPRIARFGVRFTF
jgi:Carboxypeptidase regulatory-like domain/TonB-dependent Receptor Plug Domain